MPAASFNAGVDLGLTNIDVVVQQPARRQRFTLPGAAASATNGDVSMEKELQRAIAQTGRELSEYRALAVTGGRHRDLGDKLGDTPIVHADEVASIGRGGLELSGLRKALVVSAGTGTAVVAARGSECAHVTGTAVGGGTMLGLSRLLLKTVDPREIDSLAREGDPNSVDLSIGDAIGGKIGNLPPTATAVNFGRIARDGRKTPAREDLAAAVILLVSQTISLVAINAARAEQLSNIVIVGHLMDMPSVRKACLDVADLYRVEFTIPANPGSATALGALLQLPS